MRNKAKKMRKQTLRRPEEAKLSKTTITSTEDDYVSLMREAADDTVVEAVRKRHQKAVTAASKVLADIVPVIYEEEDSDAESVAADAPGPSKGKGRGTKRAMSTRSSAKESDSSKRPRDK
jgi:hypothetical protein